MKFFPSAIRYRLRPLVLAGVLFFMSLPSQAITTFTQYDSDLVLYTGTFDEMETYYKTIGTSLAEAQIKGDLEKSALLMDLCCKTLTAMGMYETAHTMGQKSVQSYERLLETPQGKANIHLLNNYAWALCNLAEVSNRLFINPQEVVTLHEKALKSCKQWIEAIQSRGELDVETAMRAIYINITIDQLLYSASLISRDYLECIKSIEKYTKDIQESYGDILEKDPQKTIEYILALQAYANIYKNTEDYEQSLHYWRESLQALENTIGKNNHLYAYTLKEIAWIYYSMNDLSTATEYYTQSFSTYQNLGFRGCGEMADLMNLAGFISINSGDYSQATQAFDAGYELFKVTCGKKSFPVYNNRAYSIYPLWFTQQKKEAKKRIKEVMESPTFHLNTAGDHFINALSFSMEIERVEKNYKEIYKSEPINEKIIKTLVNPSKGALRQYYLTIGRTYQSDKKLMQACPYFNQTLNLQREITKQNFLFLSEEQRSNYAILDHSRMVSILRQNNSQEHGCNDIGALLYDASLLQKGQLLEACINLAHIVEEKGTPQLQQKMRYLQVMMQSNLSMAQRKECQALELEVQNEARKYGDFLNYTNILWKDVQDALDPQSVAVEFVCAENEDGSFCYSAEVLRKEMKQPYHIKLFTITKDELTRGAEKGEFNQFARSHVWPEELLQLFHPNDHIYFAPSGTLHMMPIEYMPLPNGKRINEIYHMHRLSSTREIVSKRSRNITPPKSIALFGGFNYNASADDIELAAAATRGRSTKSSTNQRTVGATYWKNLHGTLKEVEDIAPIMQKAKYNVSMNTSNAGTEQLFRDLSNTHIGIIHVATHGFFNNGGDTNLHRSGLIFTGGNKQWAAFNNASNPSSSLRGSSNPSNSNDGILTAEEISHLNLIGTNLVVLSACQTGLGEVTGEGVFGLQRSFKKAGVQSLLLSLWEVDDEATQLLMTSFYKHYVQGATKQQALQAAQDEIRHHIFVRNGKEIKGEDPYFWAAFILVDE